jgi:hypothetical protein
LRWIDTATVNAGRYLVDPRCKVGYRSLVSVSGLSALLSCAPLSSLVDMSSGMATSVAPPLGDSTGSYNALGTQWMGGDARCPHRPMPTQCNAYRNRLTGEERVLLDDDAPRGRNLDEPSLPPIDFCSPFDAKAPAASMADSQWDGRVLLAGLYAKAIEVGTCGRTKVTRISSRRTYDTSLAGGWVTWAGASARNRPQYVYAYDVERHRRWRWPVPRVNGHRFSAVRTAHTKYGIVVALYVGSVDTISMPTPKYRLLWAAWPTRRSLQRGHV